MSATAVTGKTETDVVNLHDYQIKRFVIQFPLLVLPDFICLQQETKNGGTKRKILPSYFAPLTYFIVGFSN